MKYINKKFTYFNQDVISSFKTRAYNENTPFFVWNSILRQLQLNNMFLDKFQ